MADTPENEKEDKRQGRIRRIRSLNMDEGVWDAIRRILAIETLKGNTTSFSDVANKAISEYAEKYFAENAGLLKGFGEGTGKS